MKRFALTLTIMISTLVSFSLFAQSNQTTLSIKLYPIQSIELNDESDNTIFASNNTVTLNLNDRDNLKSYSTSSFIVKTNVNTDVEYDNDYIDSESPINYQLAIGSTASLNSSSLPLDDKVSQEVPDIVYSIEAL